MIGFFQKKQKQKQQTQLKSKQTTLNQTFVKAFTPQNLKKDLEGTLFHALNEGQEIDIVRWCERIFHSRNSLKKKTQQFELRFFFSFKQINLV